MKKLTLALAAIAAVAAAMPADAAGCRIWKRTVGGLRCVCYYGMPCGTGGLTGPIINR